MALTPFVLQHAERLASKPALIDGPSGRTLTYGDLSDDIRRAAIGLTDRGFRKGDVFAMYSPNLPEYAVAFYAVASLGGIVTPVNPMATADELAGQLNDAGATYLVCGPQGLDRALEAASRSSVREVFVFGEGDRATPFASLLSRDGEVPRVTIDPEADLVVLPYSSGTTGLPKGVMLTHANLVANLAQIAPIERLSEDDTVIGVLPFFHIFGLTVVLNLGLAMGATIVTLPRFDLTQFLEAIETHGVTYGYVVPPIVLALANQPIVDEFDLSRLTFVTCGAAPLGGELAGACEERVGCHVKHGYGLTEASPVTHLNPADPALIRVGSVGPLLPNTEAKVVDPATGIEVGSGHQGELWIRGPQVMKGYWNRSEATADVLNDSWLRTGDIGFADDDGYFFVVDRLKELIKYKGFQVAPAQLEAVLLTHPAVADAAVIPYPDLEAGEVPKAFVVLKGNATPEDLMAFVAARVAPYKKVRRLEVVEQIPKSATGKILRRVLVERERAGVLGRG